MRGADHRAGRRFGHELLVAACAISAGVHAALVPGHLREEPLLGWAFVLASALLAATAVALDRRRDSRWPVRAAALLFAGLIAGYTATRASHVPGLESTPEPLDAVGLVTDAVEAAGLALALRLARPPTRRLRVLLAPRQEGRP